MPQEVATPGIGSRTRPEPAWSRLAALWRFAGWPIICLLAASALALGAIGYGIYFREHGVSKSPTDLAFQSLQLFVLETDAVPHGDTPWQLDVARFLAPLAAAAALVAAAAVVFRQELEEVRLRRRRGHVVVCGLGRRGAHLTRALVDAGHAVVAVERDEGVRSVCELRRKHVLVVIGDARDPDVLRRAGLPRAAYVAAVTGADDVNAEVATLCGELAADRRGAPLTCLADINDADLCALLRAEELSGGGRDGYRLDFINLYEQGARMMLDDHPPFPASVEAPHLAVIGLNQLGCGVIVESARRWTSRTATGSHILITAIDPEADHILAGLRARYARLLEPVRFRAISADLSVADCAWFAGAAPSTTYVCIDDDSMSLKIALELCRCPTVGTAPVIAQMNGAAGLVALLDRARASGKPHLFSLLDRAFGADLLLGGTCELLARAIHDRYRERRLREGARGDSDPALAPWEALPETLKESNRSQAEHIGVKLAAIGCSIVPSRDADVDVSVFTAPEVEMLAQMEHERWVEHRRREGWRPGPRDAEARTSPYLVPWKALGEDVRELDRETVLAVPALLSSAGYRVIRILEPDGSPRFEPGSGTDPARPEVASRTRVPTGHDR